MEVVKEDIYEDNELNLLGEDKKLNQRADGFISNVSGAKEV